MLVPLQITEQWHANYQCLTFIIMKRSMILCIKRSRTQPNVHVLGPFLRSMKWTLASFSNLLHVIIQSRKRPSATYRCLYKNTSFPVLKYWSRHLTLLQYWVHVFQSYGRSCVYTLNIHACVQVHDTYTYSLITWSSILKYYSTDKVVDSLKSKTGLQFCVRIRTLKYQHLL